MSKVSKEEKMHDLALLFVKRELKKRREEKHPWQKELENMMDDYTKSVEFMRTCWEKRMPE